MFPQRAYLFILWSTAVAAAACSDAVPTEPPPSPSAAVAPSTSNAPLERTARAFALSLADPQVRSDLRDARLAIHGVQARPAGAPLHFARGAADPGRSVRAGATLRTMEECVRP